MHCSFVVAFFCTAESFLVHHIALFRLSLALVARSTHQCLRYLFALVMTYLNSTPLLFASKLYMLHYIVVAHFVRT